MVRKQYVKVTAEFTEDGILKPMWITWTDGKKYRIDSVTECKRAASMKAGGTGYRYTCLICGKPHYLFYEENYKWFVEAKEPDH